MGDLIDSVPSCDGDHLALLEQVESLVKHEHAFCLLGNHEFNAIGWMTKKTDGNWARAHNKNNKIQHQAFLEAVIEGSKEHERWIAWFKSLPLFIDFGEVRAIHACWDEKALARLKPYLNSDNSLKEAHWQDAFDESHELFTLCEILLKGPERELPTGDSFVDKTGKVRTRERIKWWGDALSEEIIKPVVIGHYTLSGLPEALSEKVLCVDYNAAKGDNPLVCCSVELAPADKVASVSNYIFHYVNKPK